jgi:hypothetical protein
MKQKKVSVKKKLTGLHLNNFALLTKTKKENMEI